MKSQTQSKRFNLGHSLLHAAQGFEGILGLDSREPSSDSLWGS